MFTRRLREQREKLGLNKRQMANKLGIPYTTYNNYEVGAREPNSEMLIKLATEFDVSIDYLLGRGNEEIARPINISTDIASIRETVAKNLISYRKRNNLSQKELAKRIGVKHNTISAWENMINSIDIESFFKICGVLHVDANTMFGISEEKNSPKEAELIKNLRELNPEEQEQIYDLARQLTIKRLALEILDQPVATAFDGETIYPPRLSPEEVQKVKDAIKELKQK